MRFNIIPLFILTAFIFCACPSSGNDDNDTGGTPPPPPAPPTTTAATGGDGQIITIGDKYYEVHTFTYTGSASSAEYTLAFSSTPAITNATILVVAGGGGGGGVKVSTSSGDAGGGGGAGGLIIKENISINANVTVKVGKGGTGGIGNLGTGDQTTRGISGFDSSFGTETAYGGGGGGGYYSSPYYNGLTGGSSGGAGAASGTVSGTSAAVMAAGQGNIGGTAGLSGSLDAGGGGGGYGGVGANAVITNGGAPGAGGAGFTVPDSFPIADFRGLELCSGGRGGKMAATYATGDEPRLPAARQYGDGGDAGTGKSLNNAFKGQDGNNGLVVVWWERFAE